ncbi:MAG: HD domain-containing phosphohydrolase [Fervidobacterium sp.]
MRIIIESSKQLSDIDKDYVKALLSNLKQSYLYTQLMDIENELVYRLANLVETRSEETGDHVKRVSEVCYLLALDFGFDKDSSLIKGASGLHDVGKVGIPDNILNKPGKLNDQEFSIMKEHTLIGFELLKNSRLKLFELGALIALQHHERWDGTGYPYGLKGEEIAPEARIVQVADVFEALTHNRCYRPAWPVDKAIEYMYDMSGKQFDPKVIEIFKKRLWDILDIFKKFKD